MMPSLTSLPQELLAQIAEELTGRYNSSLFSLILTCKSLHTAAQYALYLEIETHLSRGCTPGWDALGASRSDSEVQARKRHGKCRQLLRTLRENPRLGRNIKGLTLTSTDSCDKSMPSSTHLCDKDCLGLLPTMLNSRLRHLKVQYPICCTFLNHSLPSLEHLSVQPSQGSRGNGQPFILDLEFLPIVMRSPRLLTLDVAAAWARNMNALESPSFELLHWSSSVESICIDVGNISERALGNLINVCAEMKTFKMCPSADFEPSRSRTGTEQWGHASNLPRLSSIAKYLDTHARTLQDLALRRGHGHWHSNLDTIGSLRPYANLRHLALEAETLLGWRHCEHQIQEDVTHPTDLTKLLPDSLETLHLTFSDFHHYRNGCYFGYDIAEGIANDAHRLQNLRSVKFSIDDGEHGAYKYCNICERIMEGNEYARVRRSSMSMLEVLDIRSVFLRVGIEFEYRPERMERDWLVSEWGYPVGQLTDFGRKFPEEEAWLRDLLLQYGLDALA